MDIGGRPSNSIDPRGAPMEINNSHDNLLHPPLQRQPPHRISFDHATSHSTHPNSVPPQFTSPANSTSTPSSVGYTGYQDGSTHRGRVHRVSEDTLTADSHELDEEQIDEDHDLDSTDPLADLKRPRACEACRQLKVRCEPDANHPVGSCRRCAKANRKCIVTQPSRKRQKKTDSRVAELERKIDVLTATLQSSQSQQRPVAEDAGASPPMRGGYGQIPPSQRWIVSNASGTSVPDTSPLLNQTPSIGGNSISNPPPTTAGVKRFISGVKPSSYGILAPLATTEAKATEGSRTRSEKAACPFPSLNNPSRGPQSHNELSEYGKNEPYVDVIDRGLVDKDTATQCFERFVKDFTPNMPVVIFPPGTTADEIRRKQPVLFLVIMSITIGPFQPEIQMQLTNDVHRIFAEKIIIKGEKSLELVQSIVISCMWYSPPERFDNLKFFQFIYLAAITALDLGIGRRMKETTPKLFGQLLGRTGAGPDRGSLEARRAWLCCYLMAVNVCMALRRPLLIRWGPYMDECVQVIESSPNAVPSDRYLVAWTRLSHIAEDVGTQFAMDDGAATTSLTDPRTQFALRGFERRMDEWWKQIHPDDNTLILQHTGHIVNLYVHEIAMQTDHSIDDFTPSWSLGLQDQQKMGEVTTTRINSMTACITSIHKVLSIMNNLDHDLITCLPTVFFARTTYCLMTLLKIHSVVSLPNSSLAHIFTPSDLAFEEHLDKLITRFKIIAKRPGGRTPGKFCMIMGLFRSWFQNQRGPLPGDLIQMAKLSQKHPSGSEDKEEAPEVQDAGGNRLHLLSEVATGAPTGHRPFSEPSIPGAQSQYAPPMPGPGAGSDPSHPESATPIAADNQQWQQYSEMQGTSAAMNHPFYQPTSQMGYVPNPPAYENSVMSGSTTQGQPPVSVFVPELGFQIPYDHGSLIAMSGMIDDSFFNFPIDPNMNYFTSE